MATRPEGSLRGNAIALAAASGVEYGIQLATPIILVRYLDETVFGQYRLIWLLANTALAIAPAFMPQSLYYFLPRTPKEQQRIYIGNVLIYLLAAGCAAGVAVSGWSPLLPAAARHLFFDTQGLSALFVALWIAASMLDALPTADGNALWQAKATVNLALLRVLLLTCATLLTADILWIATAMLAAAGARLAVLMFYIATHGGSAKIGWQMKTLKRQLAYAMPFALGQALFLLRVQSGEWVVASMFPPALYAAFSIAAVVLPIATLIRQPVYNAMMPHLNTAHARGDFQEIARLIAKSNGATALVLLPIAGGLLVTAPELVEIVYTSRYHATAPVMQVYLAGMMMNAFAVGHVLPVLNKGRFATINNAFCLALSVLVSIAGVIHWGLIGAASGSVLALAISELIALRVVAHELGMPVHRLLAWNALWPVLSGICLGTGSVMALAQAMHGNVFLMLPLKAAIYLAVFAACFFATGGRKHLGLLMR